MEITEITALAVMAAGLIWLAAEDIRRKEISLAVILSMGAIELVLSIVSGHGPAFIMTGIIPGGVCVLLSFLTKGGLGMGDALLIMSTGLWLGIWDGLFVLMLGLLLSALTGIVLVVGHRADMKTAMPFVPFYLGGFVIQEVLRWV